MATRFLAICFAFISKTMLTRVEGSYRVLLLVRSECDLDQWRVRRADTKYHVQTDQDRPGSRGHKFGAAKSDGHPKGL